MERPKEMIFAEERQSQIMKLLRKEGKVFVPQLCERFGVTSVTIRNDLNELENRGLLKRTHGGAILITKTSFEQSIAQKQTRNMKQKDAIGKLAASFVEDGDTLAVDTGTTTMAFARHLVDKKNLTIVTNDLAIAAFLEEETDATVILIGGVVRKNHHCTIGALAVKCLDGLRVDKTFMATNGLTVEGGLTTPDMNQAEVKRKLASIGSQIILLCDSEKIGTDVFVKVMDAEEIDILITDDGVDKTDVERFVQLDIDVQIAET
ncbi:MAG TPA: DeoR/GlpR transcriptional regulator [Clostridiaceae bacterium]|jgi:DeoR family fructose operon transcriptional repressor|nr:DeoR/GlpR transcriptional regulator [Clostridiaceae bacterium]